MNLLLAVFIIELISIVSAYAFAIAFIKKIKHSPIEKRQAVLKRMIPLLLGGYYWWPYRFRNPERESDPEKKILKRNRLHSSAIMGSVMSAANAVGGFVLFNIVGLVDMLQKDQFSGIPIFFPIAPILGLMSIFLWFTAYLMKDTGYVNPAQASSIRRKMRKQK